MMPISQQSARSASLRSVIFLPFRRLDRFLQLSQQDLCFRGIFSEKTGRSYDAFIRLEDNGAHSLFRLEFDKEVR